MAAIITNLILFKLVWALSLAGVVMGKPWLGPASLLVFVAWHVFAAPTAKADLLLASGAMILGLVLDTVYMRIGLIVYEGNALWAGAAPLWIMALWANFALTMNGCLCWLQDRKWLASLLGFLGGPLSYVGGIALGVATITGDEWMLYLTIGLAWAIAVPLLLHLAGHLSARLHPELHEPDALPANA